MTRSTLVLAVFILLDTHPDVARAMVSSAMGDTLTRHGPRTLGTPNSDSKNRSGTRSHPSGRRRLRTSAPVAIIGTKGERTWHRTLFGNMQTMITGIMSERGPGVGRTRERTDSVPMGRAIPTTQSRRRWPTNIPLGGGWTTPRDGRWRAAKTFETTYSLFRMTMRIHFWRRTAHHRANIIKIKVTGRRHGPAKMRYINW